MRYAKYIYIDIIYRILGVRNESYTSTSSQHSISSLVTLKVIKPSSNVPSWPWPAQPNIVMVVWGGGYEVKGWFLSGFGWMITHMDQAPWGKRIWSISCNPCEACFLIHFLENIRQPYLNCRLLTLVDVAGGPHPSPLPIPLILSIFRHCTIPLIFRTSDNWLP